MVEKERRINQDRREETKRRKLHDPYNHLPERRKTPCRRSGQERRIH